MPTFDTHPQCVRASYQNTVVDHKSKKEITSFSCVSNMAAFFGQVGICPKAHRQIEYSLIYKTVWFICVINKPVSLGLLQTRAGIMCAKLRSRHRLPSTMATDVPGSCTTLGEVEILHFCLFHCLTSS